MNRRPNKRTRWQQAVLRAKVPASTRLFLTAVLYNHMRADGSVSYPRNLLADEMGCDVRSIDRHYERAVEAGWLARTRPGYLHHTAEYEARWPNESKGSMSDTGVAHMSDKTYRAYSDKTVAHMSDRNVAPSRSTYGTKDGRCTNDPAACLCVVCDDWRHIFPRTRSVGVLDLVDSSNAKTQATTERHLRLVGGVA